ncbi:MAG: hypothetical protein Q9166_006949 [cf. Caloplaca sp. 2 TL-2023]
MARPLIALAGVGDLGRYVCEELVASSYFDVIVLSRRSSSPCVQAESPPWLTSLSIPLHKTDYTIPSLLTILNSARATTLISFINDPTPTYITAHSNMLTACTQSTHCRRLIPSEWAGDIDAHPLKPDYYALSRAPFRDTLRAQMTVEWTCFNIGWVMDYFLPQGRRGYMKPIPDKFPVDLESWRACVRGTGNELQSWTCGRDVGKAVVELCKVEAGQWISRVLALGPQTPDTELTDEMELAQVEEMMVMSYLCVPKEKTLRQREQYFGGMRFRGLEELLGEEVRKGGGRETEKGEKEA